MTVLALPYLFEQVVARFELEGLGDVDQTFGWRAPAKQLTSRRRITWTPGDPNGALGDITSPKRIGKHPRSLGTLEELCTVEIQASDPTQPANELLQYTATRLLFDDWFRAAYLAAHPFRVETAAWITDTPEFVHGRCLRVVFVVEAVIPDACSATALGAGAGALIEVTELDVTETLTVTGSEEP